MYLEFLSASRPSSSTPAFRVTRNSKHIATVTRGVIRPKRRLTQEEVAGIRAFAFTEVCDGLQEYPAIKKCILDAFGVEQTWPIQRRRAA